MAENDARNHGIIQNNNEITIKQQGTCKHAQCGRSKSGRRDRFSVATLKPM